jgi:hypothetical protein
LSAIGLEVTRRVSAEKNGGGTNTENTVARAAAASAATVDTSETSSRSSRGHPPEMRMTVLSPRTCASPARTWRSVEMLASEFIWAVRQADSACI